MSSLTLTLISGFFLQTIVNPVTLLPPYILVTDYSFSLQCLFMVSAHKPVCKISQAGLITWDCQTWVRPHKGVQCCRTCLGNCSFFVFGLWNWGQQLTKQLDDYRHGEWLYKAHTQYFEYKNCYNLNPYDKLRLRLNAGDTLFVHHLCSKYSFKESYLKQAIKCPVPCINCCQNC